MCIAFRVWRGRFRAWGRDGFRALRLEQAVTPLKKESYNRASITGSRVLVTFIPQRALRNDSTTNSGPTSGRAGLSGLLGGC